MDTDFGFLQKITKAEPQYLSLEYLRFCFCVVKH
jgi:hypothetical protein